MTWYFVADPSVTGSQNGYGSQQQMLEEENESLADQLRDKVKALKSVSEVFLQGQIWNLLIKTAVLVYNTPWSD